MNLRLKSTLDVYDREAYDDTWYDDEVWRPEETIEEQPIVLERARKALPKVPRVSPSKFTEGVFHMPKEDGSGYAPFTFEGRRHMQRIYDTPAKKVLLCCGRQVEKSTLLGNVALTYMTLVVALRILFVSPSSTQTKTFSNDRLKEPIETSPLLSRFTTSMLTKNILEKQFVNRSMITLRYAFMNADRCVVGSTRVHFADGSTATVEEVYEHLERYRGRRVWSADAAGKEVVAAAVTDAVYQGEREVFTVRLVGGAELQCTSNQPLLTWAGWKQLDELVPGDIVAVPRRVAHGAGIDRPVEEFRLVGYLLGGERHGYKKRLKELGVIGADHSTKRIPHELFAGDAEQISALLGGLYSTGGWASVSKSGQYEIGYCSNSRQLLVDMRQLLLRFGVHAYISRQKGPSTEKELGAHTLSIRHRDSVKHFAACIPVPGKQAAVDRALQAARRVSRKKDDHDRVPFSYAEARAYLKERYGLSTHSAWVKHRIQLRPGSTKDSIGSSVLYSWGAKLGDDWLMHLATSPLGWACIEEVTPAGKKPTYDLTVPGPENYLSDGLYVHNTRGIPAWQLFLDEIQDILKDNIPVIEHCLSHAPEQWRRQVYSGTPKSLDNIIEEYRANKSTQGEWVVPCEACNHWNILGEKNIGKKGVICAKCGKGINPQSKRAQWAWMVQPDPQDPNKVPWESYRIPQLMVPWKLTEDGWSEILYGYENYPRAKFMNECLGLSYESGLRPITQAQIRDACGTHRIRELEKVRNLSLAQPFFMGVDWGTGDQSYTVVVIATYVENRFRVVFAHRFVGEESDPAIQVKMLVELATRFNIALIGADYGFGFGSNHHLTRAFGAQKVHAYQHTGSLGRKVEYDEKMGRWKTNRTEVMSAIFEAIKKKKCEFPHWDDWEKPFAKDFTNIYSEYNEKLRMVQYDHRPGNPDDTFHAFLYAWLVSMLMVPRPDIIAPNKEDADGNQTSQYRGPIDQG